MKMNSRAFVVMILLHTIVSNLCAQQTLILIDESTKLPIENVNFSLGKQRGQSDKNGVIRFRVDSNFSMIFSHISFQTLKLEFDEIKTIIKKGFVQLKPSPDSYLNPVTVYAIKGKSIHETVKLDNGDWVQHDAGQLLQQIPGFSAVKKSGSFGYDPVFRGFRNDQLNILSDGVLASTAACPNRMDPPASQVLVSQARQIEIVKGPHSFRYGPAVGAVINFKTADPEFSNITKLFGRLTSGFESNGDVYRTEGMTGMQAKKIYLVATGSYSKGSNYRDGNDSIIPAHFSRGSVGLNANVQTRSNQILTLSATKNFARNTDFPVLMMDLLGDDTWMLHGQYKVTGKNSWYSQWNTQVFASFVSHGMGNLLRPTYASVQSSVDATTETRGGRTEFILAGKKSKLFFGADIKYESADGYRIRKMITGPMAGKVFRDTLWQDGAIARAGIFGEWHRQLNQFKLTFSGRTDWVYAKARNTSAKFEKQYTDNKNTDINVSMSAGVSRQWNNKWQLGVWLGRGTRSANLTERYINSLQIGLDPYEMLGNPQLKPETNNQADVVISYKAEKISVQWSGYLSLVTDYISSVINPAIAPSFGAPGVRQYINIDKAALLGFEFVWQQQLLNSLQHQLVISYNRGDNKSSRKPLPEIVPVDFRYRIESRSFKSKLSPYVQMRHVLKQDRIAMDFGEKTSPAFTTVDAGIKASLIKNFQFTVAVNNLFDEAYREHLSRYIRPTLPLNSTGRSLLIMASYNFLSNRL
jgi:iron complex outermembrane recepter protein